MSAENQMRQKDGYEESKQFSEADAAPPSSTVGSTPNEETNTAVDDRADKKAKLKRLAEIRQMAAEYKEGDRRYNEERRVERNRRRRHAERNSLEYKIQKRQQREEYAARIEEEENRPVREYRKIPGKTHAERDANRKARDRQRKARERANASPAVKAHEADRKWRERKLKAGWTEEQIEAGLVERRARRGTSSPDQPC